MPCWLWCHVWAMLFIIDVSRWRKWMMKKWSVIPSNTNVIISKCLQILFIGIDHECELDVNHESIHHQFSHNFHSVFSPFRNYLISIQIMLLMETKVIDGSTTISILSLLPSQESLRRPKLVLLNSRDQSFIFPCLQCDF